MFLTQWSVTHHMLLFVASEPLLITSLFTSQCSILFYGHPGMSKIGCFKMSKGPCMRFSWLQFLNAHSGPQCHPPCDSPNTASTYSRALQCPFLPLSALSHLPQKGSNPKNAWKYQNLDQPWLCRSWSIFEASVNTGLRESFHLRGTTHVFVQ